MAMNQSMKDLLHYHKVGTEYIQKALGIDENSSIYIETLKSNRSPIHSNSLIVDVHITIYI